MVDTNAINLSVIKQEDQYAASMIQSAKNVAHYKFYNGSWLENDIKGVLFLYKRNNDPDTGLFILNRLKIKNLIQPLTLDIEFELKEPYIFYKVPSLEKGKQPEIYGIWFSNAKDCQCIYLLLQMLTEESRKKSLNAKDSIKLEHLMQPDNCVNDSITLPNNSTSVINITEKFFTNFFDTTKNGQSLFKPSLTLKPIMNILNQTPQPPVENGFSGDSLNGNKQHSKLQNGIEDQNKHSNLSPPSSVRKTTKSSTSHLTITESTPDYGKEKFKDTLISLIQNDKEFFEKIYQTFMLQGTALTTKLTNGTT